MFEQAVGTAVAYLDLDTTGFSNKLQTAVGQLNAVGDSSLTLSQKLQSVGAGLTTMGSTLTKSVTLPIAAMGAMAVKTGGEFQQGMSQVRATMGITKDATVELSREVTESQGIFQRFKDNLEVTDEGLYNTSDVLEQLARQMGKETKFSALQAADAINVFAMAGYDVNQIIQATPEALYLASAGAMEIGEAADYATGILAGFGMEAGQMTDVTNRLAAMASNAKGDVSQFGEAMAGAAGVAGAYKQDIDDVSVALAILGNHNISASEAGNALSRVMTRLYAPTDKAAEALDELGVSAYDANGEARKLPAVLLDLRESLNGLSDEEYAAKLKDIFGQVALKQAPFLINDVATAWDGLDNSINKSIGTIDMAREDVVGLAQDMMNNWSRLKGDGKQFSEEMQEYLHMEYDLSDAAAQEVIEKFKKSMVEGATTAEEFADAIGDVGGAAKQMSDEQIDNLIGDIDILKSAFDELKISLFTEMDSPLRDFVQKLTDLINKFNSLDNSTKGLIVKIGGIAAAIGPVMTIVGKVMTFLPAITGLLGSVSAPLMLVIGAIALLVAGFKDAYENSEEFRSMLSELMSTFKEMGSLISETFGSLMQTIMPVIKNVVGMVSDSITNTLMPNILSIVDVFAAELPQLLDTFSSVITSAVELFGGLMKAIMPVLDSLIVVITDIVNAAMPVINDVLTVIADLIADLVPFLNEIAMIISDFLVKAIEGLMPLVDIILEVLIEIIDALLPTLEPLLQAIIEVLDALMPVVQVILDLVIALIKPLTSVLKPVLELLVPLCQFLADVLMLVADALKWLANGIATVVEWLISLPEKIQALRDKLVEFKDNLISGVTNFFTEMWNNMNPGLKNLILAVVDFIASVWSALTGFVQQVISSIATFFSTLWNNVTEMLRNIFTFVAEWFVNLAQPIIKWGVERIIAIALWFTKIVNKIKDFFRDVFAKIRDGLATILSTIVSWASSFFTRYFNFLAKIVTAFKEFFVNMINKAKENIEKFTEIGKNLMTGFFDGVKKVWESITEWFTEKLEWIKEKFNSIAETVGKVKEKMSGTNSDGSHATGLSYVPYNGYIAELHQGERVLTKQENEEYSDRVVSSSGDTYNFYNVKSDPYENARQIRLLKKELAFG